MLNTIFKHKKTISILVLGLAIGQAFAQYEMKKSTINSGGSTISGSQYEMTSSIGQTDANNSQSGGVYSLNGGFWHQNNDLIFKNRFE